MDTTLPRSGRIRLKSLLFLGTDSGHANTPVLLAQLGDSQHDGRMLRTKVDLQSEGTIDDKERSNERVRLRQLRRKQVPPEATGLNHRLPADRIHWTR